MADNRDEASRQASLTRMNDLLDRAVDDYIRAHPIQIRAPETLDELIQSAIETNFMHLDWGNE